MLRLNSLLDGLPKERSPKDQPADRQSDSPSKSSFEATEDVIALCLVRATLRASVDFCTYLCTPLSLCVYLHGLYLSQWPFLSFIRGILYVHMSKSRLLLELASLYFPIEQNAIVSAKSIFYRKVWWGKSLRWDEQVAKLRLMW